MKNKPTPRPWSDNPAVRHLERMIPYTIGRGMDDGTWLARQLMAELDQARDMDGGKDLAAVIATCRRTIERTYGAAMIAGKNNGDVARAVAEAASGWTWR